MKYILSIAFILLFIQGKAQSDLTAQFVTYPQLKIKKGDYLNFSFTVKNTGASASTNCHTTIYLSSSTSFSDAIPVSDISTESLPANTATQTITYIHHVSITFNSGNYLIINALNLQPHSKHEHASVMIPTSEYADNGNSNSLTFSVEAFNEDKCSLALIKITLN